MIQSFWDRFFVLCNDNNVRPCAVARIVGVSKSCTSNWKYKGLLPRQETMKRIAGFFNVSVDYLMTGEDTEYKAPILEKDVRKFLLGKYNTDKNWELVKSYIETIKSK